MATNGSVPIKPKVGTGRTVSRYPSTPTGTTKPVVKSTSSTGRPLNYQAQGAVNNAAQKSAKAAQGAVRANAGRGALGRATSLKIPMKAKQTAMGALKKVATAAMASPVGRAVGIGLAAGVALSKTSVAKKAGTAVADYAGKVTGQSAKGMARVNEATSSYPMKVKRSKAK